MKTWRPSISHGVLGEWSACRRMLCFYRDGVYGRYVSGSRRLVKQLSYANILGQEVRGRETESSKKSGMFLRL